MKIAITRRTVLMHLFFICFFLVLPALVFQRLPNESVFTLTRVIFQDTVANFILLCFFYLNYYVLIPKYYFEHKYILYVVWVLLFLIITFPLPHIIGSWMPDINESLPMGGNTLANNFPPPGAGPLFYPQNDRHAFTFSFDESRRHLYLFFTAVFFSVLLRTREHLSQVKEDKLNAELLSLKAQINPHFLFNTLNSIYALSVKKDDRASEAIVNLAGLMRYVIKDVNSDTILLGRELQYIDNYIELQKARLGNTISVLFDLNGHAGSKKITPLILITYIENAFKYGVNPDAANCLIDIKVSIDDTSIVLYVWNKKVFAGNNSESTGIGLQNTNERLKYLYPQSHTLTINEDENTYSVNLSIKLV